MATGQLTKNYRVTCGISGMGTLPGAFDTHSGIEIDSDEQKYRTGDGDWISLGGQAEPSNITISRIIQRTRDNVLIHQLVALAGKRAGWVNLQPLDEDGNTWGRAFLGSGTFKHFTGLEVDSDARSDPSMMELEFTIVTLVPA